MKTSLLSKDIIALPRRSVEEIFESMERMAKAQDEMEDYLFMSNPEIIRQLKTSRKQELAGKTKSFDSLLKKYGLSNLA